jgi:Zn-dependent peptidase ImmA (M78 family)
VAEDRRISSTLAHEAGHALMHAQLFVEHFASNLFENDPNVTQTRILCRNAQLNNRTKQHRYDGRWWEFQANRAIGALLMPKQAFLTFMQTYLDGYGAVRISDLHAEVRETASKAAASLFDVNRAVARTRINSATF